MTTIEGNTSTTIPREMNAIPEETMRNVESLPDTVTLGLVEQSRSDGRPETSIIKSEMAPKIASDKAVPKNNRLSELMKKVNDRIIEEYRTAKSSYDNFFFARMQRLVNSYARGVSPYMFGLNIIPTQYTIPDEPLECTHVHYFNPQMPAMAPRNLYTPNIAWGATDRYAGWHVASDASCDGTTITLTQVQADRVSGYRSNAGDFTNVLRASNEGMDGAGIIRFLMNVLQSGVTTVRFSTQMIWLKYWMYARGADSIPGKGTSFDGVFIDGFHNNFYGESWPAIPAPDPSRFLPAVWSRNDFTKRPTSVFASHISWRLFNDWIVGNAAMGGRNNVNDRFNVGHLGKCVYIVPVGGFSNDDASMTALTAVHLPFPLMGNLGLNLTYHFVSTSGTPLQNNEPCRVTPNIWRVFTSDYDVNLFGTHQEIYVLYVQQPSRTSAGTNGVLGLPPPVDAFPVGAAWTEINNTLMDNWMAMRSKMSSLHAQLTAMYGQGTTYQQMFELACALTYTMPPPKIISYDEARVPAGPAILGNPYITDQTFANDTAHSDHTWYKTPANEIQLFFGLKNCLGCNPDGFYTNRDTLALERHCVAVEPPNQLFLPALAFNLMEWTDPAMRNIVSIEPSDGYLAYKVAMNAALKYQIAMADIALGEVYPRDVNGWAGVNTTYEAQRANRLGTLNYNADGSLLSRMETGWYNKIKLNYTRAYPGHDFDECYHVMGETAMGLPIPPIMMGAQSVPLWVPVLEWLSLIDADIVSTKTRYEMSTDVEPWVDYRQSLVGTGIANQMNAYPILKSIPAKYEKDWGRMWQDFWFWQSNSVNNPNIIVEVVGEHMNHINIAPGQAFNRYNIAATYMWISAVTGNQMLWAGQPNPAPFEYPVSRRNFDWYTFRKIRYALRSVVRNEAKLRDFVLRAFKAIAPSELAYNTNEIDMASLLYDI